MKVNRFDGATPQIQDGSSTTIKTTGTQSKLSLPQDGFDSIPLSPWISSRQEKLTSAAYYSTAKALSTSSSTEESSPWKTGTDWLDGILTVKDLRKFRPLADGALAWLGYRKTAGAAQGVLARSFKGIAGVMTPAGKLPIMMAEPTWVTGFAGLRNPPGKPGVLAKVAGQVTAKFPSLGKTATTIGKTIGSATTKLAKTFPTVAKTASSVAKTGGKLAGRILPGLNIGLAALDGYEAVKTVSDPKASVGKKILSVATAVTSTVSAVASFVPGVGTAVSAVAGLFSFGLGLGRDAAK
ncbi:hypothetical protein L0152_13900 [bacterium]|nr:hypothetical protein [bacterium]